MSDYSGDPMNSDQVEEYVNSKRGSRGGNARKDKLSPERRSEIAKDAAKKRWGKKEEPTAMDCVPEELKPFTIHAEIIPPQQAYVVIPSQTPPLPQSAPMPYIPPPAAPAPPAAPLPPKKRQTKPMPKAFKGASSYAEKRLAEALKERAESMNKVAMLNAEIPSLVQIIRALGMTPNMNGFQDFSAPIPNMMPSYQPPQYLPPQIDQLPTAPNNIDPALFQSNSNPLPGLAPAIANAPVILDKPMGGAIDLGYVPTEEDEGPGLPKMGSGWQ
jgi:hypothetical protein